MPSSKMRIVIILLIAALVSSAGCLKTPVTDNAWTPPVTESGISGINPVITGMVTPIVMKSSPLNATQSLPVPGGDWRQVMLETTLGNITLALDPDMPITAGNFESLVEKGYYDGVIFHRVINGFMIQGGDPTGTGRGGPGYRIPDEFSSNNKNIRGAVAMANSGPNTGGSQFFINLVDNSVQPTFDSKYPVFGSVINGMEVVDAIGRVTTSGPPNDRPLQNVTITRAEVI